MNVREYSKNDYKALCEWRAGYDLFHVPELWLSETGYIIDDLACVFLYTTNSSMVFLEFLTGNPKADPVLRSKAIEVLVNKCNNEAKDRGYKLMWAMIQRPSLVNTADNLGFFAEGKDFLFMHKGVL